MTDRTESNCPFCIKKNASKQNMSTHLLIHADNKKIYSSNLSA